MAIDPLEGLAPWLSAALGLTVLVWMLSGWAAATIGWAWGEIVPRYRLIRHRCTVCGLPRHLCVWMDEVEQKLHRLGE